VRRIIITALLALISVTSQTATASAHSGLASANPAANVEISTMPAEITLKFTEELMTIGDEAVNTIFLFDPTGTQLAVANIAVNGAVLTAQIPESEYVSGTYRIEYKIVSADGHKLSDSYTFSLNAPTPVTTTGQVEEENSGVLPLPIVISIAALIALGGYLIYSKRRREE
jgi:methionine-rich copper-binding protein CopC